MKYQSRRRFLQGSLILGGLGLLSGCGFFAPRAQRPAKVPRLGYLHSRLKLEAADEAFQQGLRGLGYLEGKNIVFEYRYAEGKVDRFPDLAEELVRSNVDLIVASSNAGALAAKNATKTIPIVMVGVGIDPVEAGLVESFARPGGNITGLTNFGVEIVLQ